jgi:hypothetical protein
MWSLLSGLLAASFLMAAADQTLPQKDDVAIVHQAEASYEFAKLAVHTWGNIEEMRAADAKDLGNTAYDKVMSCVRNSRSFQLELQGASSSLGQLKLAGQAKATPGLFAQLYLTEANLWAQMGELCTKMLSAPQRGFDFSSAPPQMAKFTADLQYLDKTAMNSSPLVFAALISETPDKEGHMSRLIITKLQRTELVSLIDGYFKKQTGSLSYEASAAVILKQFLTKKGYTAFDEP